MLNRISIMNKDPSTGTSKLLLKFEIAKGVSGLNDMLGGACQRDIRYWWSVHPVPEK